jgi:hypothetical protein
MGINSSKEIMNSLTEIINNVLTNVVNTNKTEIEFSSTDYQTIEFEVEGGSTVTCDNLNIHQEIHIDQKFITKFSNSSINQITNDLINAITNETNQAFTKTIGVLGGLGNFSQDDVETTIKSIIKNTIKNMITVDNINSFIQATVTSQTIKFKVSNNSKVAAGICNFENKDLQSIQLELLAENLANNIVKNSLKNSIIQKATQTYTFEAKGLDALIWIFIVLVIGAVAILGVGVKSLTNPKFLIAVVVIIGGYLGSAYGFKWWPFKEREYWGCEIKNGSYTGACIQYPNSSQGKFATKDLCEDANRKPYPYCGNFYGCDYQKYVDGGCNKCATIKSATYSEDVYNQAEEINMKSCACHQWFVCDPDCKKCTSTCVDPRSGKFYKDESDCKPALP